MRFGTDGIRGLAGAAPIDEEGARAVGAAAARFAMAHGGATVAVARDPRPSGATLAAAVIEGARSEGALAIDCGVAPTPALQCFVAAGGADVAVMVTASHNPAADNGFKVLVAGGAKPDDAQTAQIEALLGLPTGAGRRGDLRDGSAALLSAYGRAIDAAGLRPGALAGKRLVVDLANGAAVATRALWEARLGGASVIWLNVGDGVINDGCGSEHPSTLAAAVRQHAADGGLAVDGDGDRALLVDERGEIVPGDALLWLLARATGADPVVVTVMSSTALEACLAGVEIVRTGVGDRLVAQAMRARGATLGGEESGHILVAGMPGGDGLLAGLLAFGAAAASGGLCAALQGFAVYPRRLTKVRSAGSRPEPASVAGPSAVAEAWRARLGPGRVFVRWSGTEPVLRVLVEGPDADVVEAASAEITEAWRAALS